MIRINLLPFRAARKKENIRRQVSVFLLSILFVLLLGTYFTMNLNGRIRTLQAQTNTAQSQLTETRKVTHEIAEIQKALDVLEKKTVVLTGLETRRYQPLQLMTHMTELVVAGRLWFTSLADSGRQVVINGVAMDNLTVSEFMVRLENSGLFDSVQLNFTRQQQVTPQYNLQAFGITCQRPAPVTEETETS